MVFSVNIASQVFKQTLRITRKREFYVNKFLNSVKRIIGIEIELSKDLLSVCHSVNELPSFLLPVNRQIYQSEQSKRILYVLLSWHCGTMTDSGSILWDPQEKLLYEAGNGS